MVSFEEISRKITGLSVTTRCEKAFQAAVFEVLESMGFVREFPLGDFRRRVDFWRAGDGVAIDECQDLRRAGTKKYTGAEEVRSSCELALGLSATPVFNYGGEIYNIIEVLAPGRLGARDEFYREWCHFKGNDRWALNEPEVFGRYARDEFLMLRRTRADVGKELPPLRRDVVTIPHDVEVLKKIESDITALAHVVLTGKFEEAGSAARQFDLRLRQATGVAKACAVADFVRMLVESGEKVLLGGWHHAVYDIWMERLADLNPVLYTGEETSSQKEESRKRFTEGDANVLIMSLRSGSGVDGLQTVCSCVVVGELDWSPAVHEQFLGRLNRDGQAGGVIAYFLVIEDGSDPVVSSILKLKREEANAIVNPGSNTELQDLQVDENRVKELAKKWMDKKGAGDAGR